MSILHAIRSCISTTATFPSFGKGIGGEAFLILLLFASCQQQEDFSPKSGEETMGRFVLILDADDLYTETETRATALLTDFSGYVFTLTGTTDDGAAMTNQVVILTRDGETNNYIGNVAAGTYTLTADNYVDARTGNGKPYYSATSEEFTVATATTVPVTIDLRTPKNACVTYLLDASFSALYSDPTLTIDDNGHDVTLIAPAANSTDLTSAVYCHVASSPATEMPYSSSTTRTLSYTVSAAARATSHVTDIAAVTGTLTIASGRHTTITLSANPVTGELIPLVSGEHTGVFD